MGKTTSTTKEETNFGDSVVGSHHYVTTITDDNGDSVEARGRTSGESQQRASDKR